MMNVGGGDFEDGFQVLRKAKRKDWRDILKLKKDCDVLTLSDHLDQLAHVDFSGAFHHDDDEDDDEKVRL